MDLETLDNGAGHAADRPVKRRHRPGQPFDRRTRPGRRTSQLAAIFRQRLKVGDDADPLLLAEIERAAQTVALAEAASARALRGDRTIALDDVVRLQRLADLLQRRLGLLDRTPAPSVPTLQQYLATRQPAAEQLEEVDSTEPAQHEEGGGI
jgi:hypothetical protein